MDSIQIHGGVALQGKVRIQGSKNAALPILAATLLSKEDSYICNCPKITDVYGMISLLRSLGCYVSWEENGIRINTRQVCCSSMPKEAIMNMRSSLCLLGALLGRCKEVVMEYPGGCVIGERPIDLHLSALSKMGVRFLEEHGRIVATVKELKGANIELPIASVGATENIILTAVMAKGETVINGAAREPEVVALCEYLVGCGAVITGIGSSKLSITGVENLHGADYVVPADRIVAGTYLFGAIVTGGNVFLEGAPCTQMDSVIRLAGKMGTQCTVTEDGLYVQAGKRPIAVPCLQTAPYPAFPTDLQSMALVAMTIAQGSCQIEETIFENRFRIVEPLQEMGAEIKILDAHKAIVNGMDRLKGATVEAKELRGGAALVLAGLAAENKTTITGCKYIYRGYENICKDLRELGARIVSV